MADGREGLTGFWTGEYAYGAVSARNAFSAHITESAGAIYGTVLEPHPHGGGEAASSVVGDRSGASVEFVKTYDPGQGVHPHSIIYSGTANDDLSLIDGGWSTPAFPGWTGTFVMRRSSSPAKAKARRREVSEPLIVGRR